MPVRRESSSREPVRIQMPMLADAKSLKGSTMTLSPLERVSLTMSDDDRWIMEGQSGTSRFLLCLLLQLLGRFLHAQADLAVAVDLQDLDVHHIPHLDHVLNAIDPLIGKL